MKLDPPPPRTLSNTHYSSLTDKLEGHNKWRRKVKLTRGQRIIQWFSSLPKRLIAGLTLLQRSITKHFSINFFSPQKSKGKYWEEVALPDNPEELRDISIDSALAQLPYTLNDDPIDCWKTIKKAENILTKSTEPKTQIETQHRVEPRFFETIISCNKNHSSRFKSPPLTDQQNCLAKSELFNNLILLPSGMIIDPTTGLTATMVRNQSTNKITLIFGGTNSANGASKLLDKWGSKIGKRPGRLRAQLKANWQNIVGSRIPVCYQQATKLVELLKNMITSKELLAHFGLEDSEGMLFLTGHSLGGGLAQYSAAKSKLFARTFSPAALGYKVMEDLTIEEKELARNGLICNFLIKNDPLTIPPGYKLWHKYLTPTIIGKRTVIDGDKSTGKNSLYGRHSWSHLHILSALKNKNKKNEIP